MRERIIRIPVLILLISVNLILLGTYLYERISASRVNAQEMAQVIALYEAEEITFRTQPSGRAKRFNALELGPADLDGMVLSFLDGAEYDLTYIFGAKTQYNSEGEVLIADWEQHSISYRNTKVYSKDTEESWRQAVLSDEERLILETVARKFAQRWLGDDVVAINWVRSTGTLTVTFAQVASGEIYYFNTIAVTVIQEGVQAAEIHYWSVQGEEEDLDILPMDEMLYLQLGQIRSQNTAINVSNMAERSLKDVVTSIMDGYEIEIENGDTAIAWPNMTMLMESGRQWRHSYCHE